jgi:phosphoglycolate phosphatase
MSLVVFDLDGTLIDSERDLAESTNEMLAGFGAAALPVPDVALMIGDGARVLVRRALAAAGVEADESDALARFRDIYDRRLLVHTRPYAGIEEVLGRAANAATAAVLTNKPEAPSLRILQALQLLRHVRFVVGGDSGFRRKPDPAGLEHLMALARTNPDATLVVGDSVIDVETARRAGAFFCLARYGFGQARGETPLLYSEQSAATPAEVGAVVDAFIARRRRA